MKKWVMEVTLDGNQCSLESNKAILTSYCVIWVKQTQYVVIKNTWDHTLGDIMVCLTIEYIQEGKNNWQHLQECVDLDEAVAVAKQSWSGVSGMKLSAVRGVSEQEGALLWMCGRQA